ncbi:hypothetical protein AAY473_019917 [Plecturocebus cupreus]
MPGLIIRYLSPLLDARWGRHVSPVDGSRHSVNGLRGAQMSELGFRSSFPIILWGREPGSMEHTFAILRSDSPQLQGLL